MSTDQTVTETRVVTTTETVEKIRCKNCEQAFEPDAVIRWSPDAGVDDGTVVAECHPRLCEGCSRAVFGYEPAETAVVDRAQATVDAVEPWPVTSVLSAGVAVGKVAIPVAVSVVVADQVITAATVGASEYAAASALLSPDEIAGAVGIVVAVIPVVLVLSIVAMLIISRPRRFA